MGKALGRDVIRVIISERRGIGGLTSEKPDPMNSVDNKFGLHFHHFGLAVPRSDEAFRFLKALNYTLGATVFDPLQLVNLAMCTHSEMPDVEVVWPSDFPSPIDRLLRRGGPMVYHLCYVAQSPQHAITAMEKDGFNVVPISEPKPAVLFGGKLVSFYNVDNIGLIEIIHNESPDNMI
jgi:Glyoxalase/Bleomycin resistance protein/Dioxygenase superfamily